MRTIPAWVDKVHDRDKLEQCIYSLCFNPEGSQLIVAAGQRVLVYNANDGSLIQPLKGHEKTVFCVNYAKDGKRFASGSADKNVIIWSSKLEGLLKYSHGDAVQCVEFNPVMQLLASCSSNELILWSPEAKSVGKHKTGGRVLACSWSEDGQLLALGLSTGQVTIRNRNGEEKTKIERPSQSSIWALAWGKHKEDGFDVLCVTDWAQTMSFHSMSGKSVGKERKLGFEALCVRYMDKGDLLLVCGCSKWCSLYTKEGVRVAAVGDQQNSWVWSAAAHPTSNFIALGCQDGTIAYYQVVFNKVHGLYKERYAYRENLTDVIIQHLLTDQKVKIKCRDLVKKIAIYKNRLAVQLGDRVTVYELYSSDTQGMQYRVKEKLGRKVDCYLLVVCSNHLVLCEERRLQSLTLGGTKEREWELDSAIKFIKVVGGPPSHEGLLTGLANGQVLKIFLDNPFPVNLLKIGYPVKCLDLSPSRRKVAIVDDNQHCLVYNLADKKLIYQELNATSVAWNSCCEDMLCFSGNNLLGIKANGFPVHQQKLQGYVVGFCSSKIFCFFNGSMSSIDVPLSAPMYQYLEKKMFREAYETACLGVTEGDWRTLGNSALDSLQLEVARLAFVRVKDLLYLDLIHQIKEEQLSGETASLGGLVLAYRRRYKEAARAWARIGRQDLALQMYTQLRMFDQGQEFLSGSWTDKASLLRKKADWAEEIKEPRAAAQIYLAAGEELKAVRIMAEYAWVDMLTELGRKSADEQVLRIVADTLLALNLMDLAAEVFRKLGDEEAVLKVQVMAQDWPPALATADANPRYRTTVYLPYARYLAENDNFFLAQKAYQKAGHPEEAFRVVKQLTENAISESRFNDAGYFFWLLASHSLQRAGEGEADMLKKYHEYDKYATIYYAYHSIQRYLEEPFTAYQPESLFNIARFLMQETKFVFPPGVSQFAILYAMSKQAKNLGAYKLAIQVLNKLQTLKIPAKFQEYVEVTSVMVKGKPYLDNEELLVMCYRCSSYNPLLTPQTAPPNTCTNCGQPFLHSFLTFEVLPLVEFKLEEGLSEDEALRLLEGGSGGECAEEESWREELGAQVQSLRPSSTQRLGEEEVLTRSSLRRMDPSDVVICRFPPPLHTKYYRNLLPELQLTVCLHCNKIFHMDDLEMKLLEKDSCPFCRLPSPRHQPPPSL